MPEYVRAKHPSTGAHITTTADAAEMYGMTVLKSDALDAYGRVLPPKPATDKAGQPAATPATADQKEAAK